MDREAFAAATIPQLAAITQISEDTWRQYLYKDQTPGINFLRKAATKLNMTLDELDKAISNRRQMIQKQRQIRNEIDQLIAANT